MQKLRQHRRRGFRAPARQSRVTVRRIAHQRDAADGYPGLPGWGAKSSAAVLAKFLHLESIPVDCRDWRVNANNASALAATMCEQREQALLFRTLATLRTDIKLFDDVEQLRWSGPKPEFDALSARLDAAKGDGRGGEAKSARRPESKRRTSSSPD